MIFSLYIIILGSCMFFYSFSLLIFLSTIERNLDHFQLLIINIMVSLNALMNLLLCRVSLDSIPNCWMAGSQVLLNIGLYWLCQIVLQSTCTTLHSHKQFSRFILASHPDPHLVWSEFKNFVRLELQTLCG